MAKDHTSFMEEESEALMELPGFPYLRFEPILLQGNIEDVDELWRSEQEELLFLLHGAEKQLLLVSNHRIRIFEIPAPTSLSSFAGSLLFSLTPVGELVGAVGDAYDNVKDMAGAANTFRKWVSPKHRRQRADNTAAGMPNTKDFKDVVWDTEELEILAMITCYKERVLLENAFKWKLLHQIYWQDDENRHCAVRFGENQVTFTTEVREREFQQVTFDMAVPCGVPEVAQFIAEANFPLLENAGWMAGLDDGVFLYNVATFQSEEVVGSE